MPPKSSKVSQKAASKACPKSKQVSPKASPARRSTSTKIVKFTPERSDPPAPQELDVRFRPQYSESAPVLAKALAALRGKGELCDVFLLVKGGSQLPAHSVVLTAQSEVLCEMLRLAREETLSTQTGDSELNTPGASEQQILVDGSEPATLERPSQSYCSAGLGRKESLRFEMVPAREPCKPVWRAETPVELNLATATREAVEWMLRWVYGEITIDEYRPMSDDVNDQVMTLAQNLKIPSLLDLGAFYLTRGVYAHNVVQRMWNCQKFGLMRVRELLVEALVKDRANLDAVVSNPEMSKHPELLREMLAAVANQTGPVEEGSPQKRQKK